ncbi:hypothetical protein LTR66_016531, partial [Elasticomyces elasticus]
MNKCTGVSLTLSDGSARTLRARTETILCGGAVDTPRLMLHSGIGPRDQLKSLGMSCHVDLPGVGENLLDHPETIIMWELNKPVPANQTTMDSDAGIFLRREAANAAGQDGSVPDVMMHCYQIPFTLNTERLGYDRPKDAFCMTPNIPRPRSIGKLYLTSSDPAVKPALDFRYFTDPEGYDAATFVFGIKAARKIAQEQPFKSWLKREVAPGPSVQTDEDISEYARRAAHTVYHPAGTTKMGDVKNDKYAVVDSKLKVKNISSLRIADAGVFPAMVTINPMLTVLGIGERAAEMIAEEAGWSPQGFIVENTRVTPVRASSHGTQSQLCAHRAYSCDLIMKVDTMADITPYTISVSDSAIDDMKARLALAKFPDELDQAGWDLGSPLGDVQRLTTYWLEKYDWRIAEAELNKYPQYTTKIQVDGFDPLDIHFVYKKSTVENAIPLLFVHGWPGSYHEGLKIFEQLVQGDGTKDPAFDVVLISLPNYGWSEGVKKRGFAINQYAECCNKLMLKLGYG